jgi:hypothetical protein
MKDNVVVLPVVTTLPTSPERVLKAAIKNHGVEPFCRVLVIGVTEDREYFASSDPDGGTCLWDMERARHKLMQIVDGGL